MSRQEIEYSWYFVFLGANRDAVAIGQKMGVDPGRSMTSAPGFSESDRESARGSGR